MIHCQWLKLNVDFRGKSVRWSQTPSPLAYAVYAFINVDNCERPLMDVATGSIALQPSPNYTWKPTHLSVCNTFCVIAMSGISWQQNLLKIKNLQFIFVNTIKIMFFSFAVRYRKWSRFMEIFPYCHHKGKHYVINWFKHKQIYSWEQINSDHWNLCVHMCFCAILHDYSNGCQHAWIKLYSWQIRSN